MTAVQLYEKEYEKSIDAQNSIELANALEGKNEKGIIFYRFTDHERNGANEMIDAYGNPVIVINQKNAITLYSFGKDGVRSNFSKNDDIIIQHERQNQSE